MGRFRTRARRSLRRGGAAGDPDGDRRGSGAVPGTRAAKGEKGADDENDARRAGEAGKSARRRGRGVAGGREETASESATIESAVAESAAATFDGVSREDGGACEHDRGDAAEDEGGSGGKGAGGVGGRGAAEVETGAAEAERGRKWQE